VHKALTLISAEQPDGNVRWYEVTRSGFALHATPLDVAGPLREHKARTRAAWILTSATLAVGESFDHVKHQTGFFEADTIKLDSPFDYARQALLYLPPGLPEPNQPGYTRSVVEAALPVLEASGGRAFLLFTSHRALGEAAELLRERGGWPLFVQGEAPRAQLLEQFRHSGNGVLLGAASFWEGVDVRGDALSLVVIDKLPFAQIQDPVVEARMEDIRARGGSPFGLWQLPQAAITLKQGAGRLIRDVTDRGVLMLCDPRVLSKSYGRTFLNSLPPMRQTRDLAAVRGFFDS
jgi:ATP-dependent DNA helicase DinG